MTKVNMGTNKAAELMHDMTHYHSKGKTLYEVYGHVSYKKIQSWENIKKQCEALNGENLHIVGAGSYNYSCIYAFPRINEETGEIEKMVIRKETVGNTFDLELPIEEYRKLV